MSKRLKLQPWVIFTDVALEDMTILYPITVDELKHCQNVGEGKAKKFGKEFAELIKRYVEENEIIRPNDFVVKTVVNKSANKVHIITGIDRMHPLDDIAEARGMEMDELLDEIESIVYSGTKLNIDYYIRQEVDEDKVEEIYDYFRNEAESDSIADAIRELGPDFTEEEVRLVRIKFLCEVSN